MPSKIEKRSPSQEAAYQQGVNDRAAGLNIPRNPFVTDEPENLAWYWHRGWSAENSDILDRIREKNS